MYNPDTHHRHSVRMADYDYSRQGAYFITVCVQDRAPLLGRIAQGEIQDNAAGRMVREAWQGLSEWYPGVETDAFVVMPNHIHGICLLGETQAFKLSDVLQRFKSWTTTCYRRGVQDQQWPPFNGRFWQRNYYERVIRSEREWLAFREYIILNPARCEEDEEYVA